MRKSPRPPISTRGFEALRKLNRKSALLTLSDGQGEVSFVAITLPITE